MLDKATKKICKANEDALLVTHMKLAEIIEIRDKLKAELSTVEKFLEIARKYGTKNGEAPTQPRASSLPDPNQPYQPPARPPRAGR